MEDGLVCLQSLGPRGCDVNDVIITSNGSRSAYRNTEVRSELFAVRRGEKDFVFFAFRPKSFRERWDGV